MSGSAADDRISHFTIVGGGSAGWLTASLLVATLNRRNDGPDTRITLIESPRVPIVGVGEATTVSTFVTFAQLRLDEFDFLKFCDGSFKAAVRFRGWDFGPDGAPLDYYHPFDAPSPIFGIAPAYHYHRLDARGAMLPPFAHCMSALPALIDQARAPRRYEGGPYEGLASYSYHLDASKLGQYLKEYCTSLGVEHVSDDVQAIRRDGRGFVTALELERRGTFPVEFVIDCSGFGGLILRREMEEPFIPYGQHLLCDRALAVQLPHRPDAPLDSCTTSTALGAGWSWNVPLHSRRGTGYVFSSAFRSDDEAIAEFRAHLGPDGADAEPRVIPMSIGRLRRGWVNNCLGVGLSAGFVEPLESTSIHLIQIAIRRFLEHLPDRRCDPVLIGRYNALITEMYEDIRDFIAMHYAVSNRPGAFWEAARSADAVPDRVRERLALWRRKLPGPLDVDARNPLFTEWSYLYVLFGKRYFDGLTFPLEAAISDDDFNEFQAELGAKRQRVLEHAPDHRALLDRIHASDTEAWYRPDAETLPGR